MYINSVYYFKWKSLRQRGDILLLTDSKNGLFHKICNGRTIILISIFPKEHVQLYMEKTG